MPKVKLSIKLTDKQWDDWQNGKFSLIDGVAEKIGVPDSSVEIIDEGHKKSSLKKVS